MKEMQFDPVAWSTWERCKTWLDRPWGPTVWKTTASHCNWIFCWKNLPNHTCKKHGHFVTCVCVCRKGYLHWCQIPKAHATWHNNTQSAPLALGRSSTGQLTHDQKICAAISSMHDIDSRHISLPPRSLANFIIDSPNNWASNAPSLHCLLEPWTPFSIFFKAESWTWPGEDM